jgi:class 3 adenylate cyclase
LIDGRNVGFVVATPIGLAAAAAIAAFSALDLRTETAAWIVRRRRALRLGAIAVLAGWAVFSVAELPPFDGAVAEGQYDGLALALAAVGLPLFAFAAVRYLRLHAARHDALTAAIAVAWVLLAEALLAIAFARPWRVSWWEWHALMAAAFALIAWTAYVGYRRSASLASVFGGIYLEGTLARLDDRSAAALRRLVGALERDEPLDPVLAELRRDGLSADEAALLAQSARELRRVDSLFRPYVSPGLAAGLEQAPELAELGGREREVTVLFADLEGFTSFSERHEPAEAIAMLNAYWEAAVPGLLVEGATIERFAGDAVMAVFNAVGDQPDHAQRAARAAVAMRDASARLAAEQPGWPRFRLGLNTGSAAVGHVGTHEQRSFAAIGDTTNLAARLQAAATPGQILVAAETASRLGPDAQLEPLPPLALKGKSEPVEAFRLARIGSGRPAEEEDAWQTSR